MKKLLLLGLIGLFISCADQQECETGSNGFITGTGQSVTLGSEATVDVFKAIDKAWLERDYTALKTLISDNGNFTHDDNSVSTNADEFISHIEAGYQESVEKNEEWVCTTNFASYGDVYEEWYQIVDGKLVTWSSAKRENK